MEEEYYRVIFGKYGNKEENIDGLFKAILSIGDEIGLERALGYLERCIWIMGAVSIFHVKRARVGGG